MVGGLGALGALGSIGSGVSSGMDAEARRKLLALQAQQLSQQNTGNTDAGNALSGAPMTAPQQQGGMLARLGSLFGGGQGQPQGQLQGAPQPQMGGRPASPQMGAPPPQAAPQQPPSQAGAPPQAPPGSGQGQQPPGGAPITKLDFPTILQLFQQKGLTGARLMSALNAVAPMMNLQAQQQYKQVMMSVAQQNAGSKSVEAGAASKRADTGAAGEGEKERSDKAKEGATQQRLALEAQKLKDNEAKAASDASIKTLSQWQAANKDAETERQRAVGDLNAAYTNTSDPDQEGTIKMLKENLASADARIKALHDVRPNVQDDVGEGVHPGNPGKPDGSKETQRASGAPQAGDVQDGYRFKGGDPSDKNSWEPLK